MGTLTRRDSFNTHSGISSASPNTSVGEEATSGRSFLEKVKNGPSPGVVPMSAELTEGGAGEAEVNRPAIF